MLSKQLLSLLVCPCCKGPLVYQEAQQELICRDERLAFPIRDGIPVMLRDEARELGNEE